MNQALDAGLVTDRLSIVDAAGVRGKVDVYRWKEDGENKGAKRGPDEDKGHIKARYPDDAERARYYRRSRERWKVEPKFNGLKNHHSLKQARYYGLAKVKFRALMVIIAVDVKSMVTLLTGAPRWVIA